MLGTLSRIIQASGPRDRAALAHELRALADVLDPAGQAGGQESSGTRAARDAAGDGQGGEAGQDAHEAQAGEDQSRPQQLIGQALCDAIMAAYDHARSEGLDNSSAIKHAASTMTVSESVARYHVDVGYKQRRQADRQARRAARNRRAYELAGEGHTNRAIAQQLREEGHGSYNASSVSRMVMEEQGGKPRSTKQGRKAGTQSATR